LYSRLLWAALPGFLTSLYQRSKAIRNKNLDSF